MYLWIWWTGGGWARSLRSASSHREATPGPSQFTSSLACLPEPKSQPQVCSPELTASLPGHSWKLNLTWFRFGQLCYSGDGGVWWPWWVAQAWPRPLSSRNPLSGACGTQGRPKSTPETLSLKYAQGTKATRSLLCFGSPDWRHFVS